MAYVRKNLTPEQRHEQAVRAARAVKNHNGGRKKGIPNKKTNTDLAKLPTRSVSIREPDYQVFVKMAAATNMTIVDFMHSAAERLKELNPDVFKPSEIKIFERK